MSRGVRAVDITKHFGDTAALGGVSVEVEPGEILAVMGPSGSGKSTLLYCLAGIYSPDSGAVLVGDADLGSLSDDERSDLRIREMGFVFQFGQLVPELSAWENVALPLLIAGTRRGSARAEALEWLDRLGVADLAQHRPDSLSGGQSQRVAIARALVHGPSIILADEPTGALDSLGGEQVMRLLVDAARERSCALVIVTHEARVAAWCDREIRLRDGKVAAAVPVEA